MDSSMPGPIEKLNFVIIILEFSGLSFFTTEMVLAEAFSQYGKVIEAKIIMNRDTGRSKGFGFVTFASEEEAVNALAGMCGKELSGRVIFVDYAKATQEPSYGAPVARGPPELPPSKE
ncbi:Small RNA-binding protein 11, chloroplastic [Asimina triloba]